MLFSLMLHTNLRWMGVVYHLWIAVHLIPWCEDKCLSFLTLHATSLHYVIVNFMALTHKNNEKNNKE